MDIEYDDLQPGVSPDERKRGIKRIIQIVLGVVLIAAGIAMLVLPGQGILTILVGLNLLKPDNALARWIRRRIPGIPEDGTVPMRYVVLGLVFMVVSSVVAIIWGRAMLDWTLELIGMG